MKFKKILGKVLPIIDSDNRKQKVVNTILKMPDNHHGVINIHRYDKNNVGDYFCAPHQYFEELNGKVLDINGFRSKNKNVRKEWSTQVSDNALIIGGGGLLNIKHFEKQMSLFEELAKRGKKIVFWGPGHNQPNIEAFLKKPSYNIDTKLFKFAGLRDYSLAKIHVPCVSCMNTIFDTKFETTQDVGIIFNKKSVKNPNLLKKFENYHSTSNTTNLEEMVSFIGRTETVISNSYHAIYWATLLGKKTIGIPSTSKFYDFKYKPVLASFDDFEQQIKNATSRTGVLEEYRALNINYSQDVFDYLNL
jgi:exopolysaccharide biosynthesis predicted pyruvyltransferase EpsI